MTIPQIRLKPMACQMAFSMRAYQSELLLVCITFQTLQQVTPKALFLFYIQTRWDILAEQNVAAWIRRIDILSQVTLLFLFSPL